MDALDIRPWDAAPFLKSEEAIATYLDECLADGDAHTLVAALGFRLHVAPAERPAR